MPVPGLTPRTSICLLWLAAMAFWAPGAEAEPQKGVDHWAYQAPVKASGSNTIDGLLSKERTARGLVPQGPADPLIWLRRVYLDLVGLPPTLEEMAAFEADHSLQARQKVVDHLLESPQYGERWGRHFMDIWRYSDWYGLGAQLRNSQKHLWHWRDWIIESLNADKGYDRMIQEMLAGDEIAPEDPDTLRATGFLARNYYLFNRTTWLDDVIEHTSKAFLGITMNCVKCHEHKFDPIPQQDYYAFRAIFEPYHVRLDELPGQPDLEKDGLPRAYDLHLDLPTYVNFKGDEKRPDTSRVIAPGIPSVLAFKPLDVKPVSLSLKASRPETQPFVVRDHREAAARALAEAEGRLASARGGKGDLKVAALGVEVAKSRLAAIERHDTASNLAYEVAKAELALAEAKPDKRKIAEQVLKKARENQEAGKGEPIRLVASLKALEGPDETDATRYLPFPQQSTGRRLALARWMTDRRNPLTARVLVNHVWMRHFGQPLVADVMDFGLRSKAPEMQALLDWLAVDFMENGWSLKRLHRQMVLSETYAMTSSKANAASVNASRDPENHFYWRMNPTRMDAQSLRDSLLHLSGRLDLTMGGAPLDDKAEDKVFRRSLYFTHSRDNANRFLEAFDNANILECYRRAESIVPQQALALMNAKTSMAAAEVIASKLSEEHFVTEAFKLVLATHPGDEEIRVCTEALHQMGNDAHARAGLIHTLLNHNDFITVR